MTIRHQTRSGDDLDEVRKAIAEANRLAGYLQGTMSLEGQGLDREKLRTIQEKMVLRLLRAN
jgi:hypothetical protein